MERRHGQDRPIGARTGEIKFSLLYFSYHCYLFFIVSLTNSALFFISLICMVVFQIALLIFISHLVFIITLNCKMLTLFFQAVERYLVIRGFWKLREVSISYFSVDVVYILKYKVGLRVVRYSEILLCNMKQQGQCLC